MTAMTLPSCNSCGHQFAEGDDAYGIDWHVITPEGTRLVLRYLCVDCHDRQAVA